MSPQDRGSHDAFFSEDFEEERDSFILQLRIEVTLEDDDIENHVLSKVLLIKSELDTYTLQKSTMGEIPMLKEQIARLQERVTALENK